MKGNIEKLDTLRGIAILLVFFYHALIVISDDYKVPEYENFLVASGYELPQLLMIISPIGMGFLGVQLFLILSGFLIHWGYLRAGSKIEYSKFYNKRFWRIYPAYFVALTFFVLTVGYINTLDITSHYLLIHNLFDSTFYSINGSFWSLALEVQLYLIYPIFLLLHRSLGLNKATLAVGIIWVITTVLRYVLGLETSPAFSDSVGSLWIVWVLGAYLGEKFYHNQRLSQVHPFMFLIAYVALLAVRMTFLFDIAGPLLFSFLFIYVIDWYLHSEFKIPEIFDKPIAFLNIIGLCSYSLYLFHQPLLRQTVLFFSPNDTSKPSLLFGVIVAFFVFLSISYASYKLIELNFVRVGSYFYNKFIEKAT